MWTDAPLKTRHLEILHSIVRAYIETGEPVGSRTISKRRSSALSPASARNFMADLAHEGYLSQPHTSAGPVPADKALQAYLRSLTTKGTASFQTPPLRTQTSGPHNICAPIVRCT